MLYNQLSAVNALYLLVSVTYLAHNAQTKYITSNQEDKLGA